MWLAISLIASLFGLYHALPKCNYLAYENYFYIAADVCIPWGFDYGTYINYTQSSRYECTSSEAPKSVSYQDGECITDGFTSGLIISKDQSSCEFSLKTCSYVSLIYTLADQNFETNECDRYAYSRSPMVYKYPVITECLPFAMNNKYYYKISCDKNLEFNYNLYTNKKCTTLVSDQIYSVYKDNIDDFFACFQCTDEHVQGNDNDDDNDDDDEDDTDNNNTGNNTDNNINNTNTNNNNNNNGEFVTTTISPIVTIFETSPNSGHTLNNNLKNTSSSNNNSASIISIISIVVIFIFAIILFAILVFYRRKKRAMQIVNAVAMSNNDHTIYNEEEEQEEEPQVETENVHTNGETMPIHANATETN